MKHLDLFAGIGGFALAARWMGWETAAFVEKEKFCHRVLNKNFPGVPIYDDIFTFDGRPFRGSIDIITGGFPCQPFSAAGKRKGRDDERHLFPEMLRVVAEVRPRWVVAENVRGLLSIESGRVFAEVVASLEGEGYEVITFCVPASAVGAPHRRDRLWIVAHNPQPAKHDGLASGTFTGSDGTANGEQSPRTHTAADIERASGDARNAEDDTGGQKCGLSERQNAITRGSVADAYNAASVRFGTENEISARRHGIIGTDRDATDTHNSGNRTRESGTHAKRPPLGIERRDSQPQPGRHGADAANAFDERYERRSERGQDRERPSDSGRGNDRAFGESAISGRDAADAGDTRLQGSEFTRTSGEGTRASRSTSERPRNEWNRSWIDVAAATCHVRVDDGLSDELDVVGSRDNRASRLKALGNAIVPEIAFQIFKAIEQAGEENYRR